MNATESSEPMHDRARMNDIISGLEAWYDHTDANPPTDAQVESLLVFLGDRGIGLTAGEMQALFKLGRDRIDTLHNIICGHAVDAGDDEKVTDMARLIAIRGRVKVITRSG